MGFLFGISIAHALRFHDNRTIYRGNMANPSAALRQVVPSNEFESLLNEKRDVTSQLSKALDENAALNRLYKQTCAEFDCERIRLNSEIAKLRSQLTSRLPSLLAAKEKLMKEEFDRKFQELTLEVKQERYRYRTAIEEMKKQMTSCICRVKNR
jgi:hypothetical protein